MDDWGCFSQPIALRNIDNVRIAVVNKLDSSERMVPPKIHSPDANEMRRKVSVLNRERFFRHGKYAAGAKDGHAINPCFSLMRCVTCRNLLPHFRREVLRIVYRSGDNDTVRMLCDDGHL